MLGFFKKLNIDLIDFKIEFGSFRLKWLPPARPARMSA